MPVLRKHFVVGNSIAYDRTVRCEQRTLFIDHTLDRAVVSYFYDNVFQRRFFVHRIGKPCRCAPVGSTIIQTVQTDIYVFDFTTHNPSGKRCRIAFGNRIVRRVERYVFKRQILNRTTADHTEQAVRDGCGKGRVDFFLEKRTKARTIGIEYDARIYASAVENQKSGKFKAEFVLTRAEEYPVPPEVDRCYFFNPFSVEILHKVMARILESYYASPREMLLFFYFPSDEFISYLMTVDALDFYDEIPCDDLFDSQAQRERILIFALPF